MRRCLKAGLIRATLPLVLSAACTPLWSQGAHVTETEGPFVTDALRGVPRTAVTGECIRTGISTAGRDVTDCLPAVTARPAAKTPPVPEPTPPEFVGEPEPRDMKPVPPMEPLAAEDDRLSDPIWYYDEEPTPTTETILGRTVNPDYAAELAAAEAEMARSGPQAPTPERSVPASVPPVPPKNRVVRLTLDAALLFDFNKAVLRPTGKNELDKLLSELQDMEVDAITVVGHTDRIGSAPANRKLSQRRADSVKEYLASNHVAPGKIVARGAGSTQPITKPAECKGLKGRKLIDCLQPDRRVEIVASGGEFVRQ